MIVCSYPVRIIPNSFIGDVLPARRHTRLVQLGLILARQYLVVLCVRRPDTLEPRQSRFPLLRSVQHSHLEHKSSQNLLDKLLINALFRFLVATYLARQRFAQILGRHQTVSVVAIKLGSQSQQAHHRPGKVLLCHACMSRKVLPEVAQNSVASYSYITSVSSPCPSMHAVISCIKLLYFFGSLSISSRVRQAFLPPSNSLTIVPETVSQNIR